MDIGGTAGHSCGFVSMGVSSATVSIMQGDQLSLLTSPVLDTACRFAGLGLDTTIP